MPTGDPIADRICEAIEAAGQLSKSQILRLFHGNVESNRIEAALETLVTLGALGSRSRPTGGRPSTHWSALVETQHEQNEESVEENEELSENQ